MFTVRIITGRSLYRYTYRSEADAIAQGEYWANAYGATYKVVPGYDCP